MSDIEVINEITSYGDLSNGWDGEKAAKPKAEAIADAIRFVRGVSSLGLDIVPTLHVDGSVILELGSIRFGGHGPEGRNAALEEAAKLADEVAEAGHGTLEEALRFRMLAERIRSLKEKEDGYQEPK